MPKLVSRIGHIAAEVKDFIDGRVSLSHVRATAGHAVDLIFPPHGLGGDGDALMQPGLQPGAWSRIRFLADEGCDMCARPFDGGLHYGIGAHCSGCVEKPFPFGRTRAACVYDEASRDIILGFKHADRLDLAPMLVRWLERAGADLLRDTDALMPVPLHPSRLLKRRYNQAAELARPLARHAGKPYLPDSLVRTQKTKQQGNSADARWDNVRNAFAVSTSGAKRIAGKKLLLVDDVFTTGATLRACTQTLLKAGAASVDALVLARVASS